MYNMEEHKTDTLNMLVEINNDRIEGYNTAISLLPTTAPIAVRSAFENHRDQSIQFNAELKPLIFRENENPDEGTRLSGKIFRIWMDIKAMVSPSTTKSVLETCLRGEEEYTKVYKVALEHTEYLNIPILIIIENQLSLQMEAYNHIILLSSEISD